MAILTANPKNVPTLSSWQEELKSAFRDLASLFEFLELKNSDFENLMIPDSNFPIFVPRPFAGRMQKGVPTDPLLQQVISTRSTGLIQGDWSKDPVSDREFEKAPGVLHKYKGRVLFVITGACAIHCRYCFRQNFDYSTAVQHGVKPAIEYVKNDSSISEVILSGGDPLMKPDDVLASIFDQLGSIRHVKRVRIHTRMPVVLPARITAEFRQLLSTFGIPVWVVLHINHAAEIDETVVEMIEQLHSAGVTVLNQAVLLSGVNDQFEAQLELCQTLINHRVVPYYLHLLDQVSGAEGYHVCQEEAARMIRKLRAELPGFAVPSLVKEVPGASGKTVVC